MKNSELSAIVDQLINDSVSYNSEFMSDNEEYLRRYNQECYGDEEEGFSSVVASDVRDTVDSDMTSLVRVFLGSGDVMVMEPVSDDDAQKKEAEVKTKTINHLVLRRPTSYKTIHSWLKDTEIQKAGVVHYYVDTVKHTREEFKKNLTLQKLTALKKKAEEKKGVEKVEIVGKEKLEEEGKFNARLRITTSKKELFIDNIPTEDFLLTRNSASKDDATAVGHQSFPTRSELVASGMSEEEVAKFPSSDGSGGISSAGQESTTGSGHAQNMKAIRWRDEGGDITDTEAFNEWATEKVRHILLFANVDYDGDGIAERRRIVKIGNTVTENEPYDHVPYALNSCIIEPHKAIGDSRASLVIQDQSVSTEIIRSVLDNAYDHGNPRTVLGNDVNHDDFYDERRSGVVRMMPNASGTPRESVEQLVTPYIGDSMLQVQQFMDQKKANRTGTMLASQGLEADQLHQETATRFDGVEKANEAKIELVARNLAEVGFRDLYDGIEWTLSRFFDEEIPVRIDGKIEAVNPSGWEFETVTVSQVGLGAAAGEELNSVLTAIYSIQQQLKADNSLLTDDQKLYNTLDQMISSAEMKTSDFFNNPAVPQELLFAQVQQLTAALAQSQEQLDLLSQELERKNELSEAALVETQGRLELGREKNALDAAKFEASQQMDAAKFAAEQENKEVEMIQKTAFHESDKTLEYTKLELEHSVDIPGEGADDK